MVYHNAWGSQWNLQCNVEEIGYYFKKRRCEMWTSTHIWLKGSLILTNVKEI